jgi:hypothetical protein
MIGESTLGSPLREICTMGSERGDEHKTPCSLGEGTGSKEPDYGAAPQWATASRLVPTHQQDHRAIKRRCAPMLALKSFRKAAVTLAGVELAHRIRKRQFSIGPSTPSSCSSLKHLWARALERHGAEANGARRHSYEANPPMHQNSRRLLTERDICEIKPVRYARKVTVGRGLFLLVMPPGGRSWRYKYYFGGKCKQLVLGLHPEISLECAKSRINSLAT